MVAGKTKKPKYQKIDFLEPDIDLYRKIKATEVLSYRELEYVSYLSRLNPCTVSDILEKITEENSSYTPSQVTGFNKLTKPLKNLGSSRFAVETLIQD